MASWNGSSVSSREISHLVRPTTRVSRILSTNSCPRLARWAPSTVRNISLFPMSPWILHPQGRSNQPTGSSTFLTNYSTITSTFTTIVETETDISRVTPTVTDTVTVTSGAGAATKVKRDAEAQITGPSLAEMQVDEALRVFRRQNGDGSSSSSVDTDSASFASACSCMDYVNTVTYTDAATVLDGSRAFMLSLC